MNSLLRVTCVLICLTVLLGLAGTAAASENGKQCAPGAVKAGKEKGEPAGRTAISTEPWAPQGGPQDKVVYGTDDRVDVYQETDPLRLELAGSVCGLVDAGDLTPATGGKWTLSLYNYTQGGHPACPEEPFGSQPVAAWCTGFLVGKDLIATAGHCFSDGDQSYVRFIFGFEMTDATTPVSLLEANQVYSAVEVVGWALSGGLDYCIVRVDREVTAPGAQPLPIRRTGTVPLDTAVGVIGHPSGLPKKIAFGSATKVAANSAEGYFTSNLDTYGGNSGSPVFNAATGVVEGILVRGETDFVLQGDCFVSNVLPDSAAGEEVSKSTTFSQFIPEYTPDLGKITLDKEAYKPTDIVQITLEDTLAAPSADVEIVGEFHTKTLTLNAVVKTAVAQFTGAVQLYTSGKTAPTEGLYVVDGGEMTVRYNDADAGSGSPAVVEKTVPIDGTAPSVTGATVSSVGGSSATILVEADEPVTATVHYGTDCAALTGTAQSSGGPAGSVPVTLTGLSQETTYSFSVEVADLAGNTAVSDNGGACFTLTTTGLNDTCAQAWPLTLGAPVSGSNAGAATDYDAGDGSGADVWFAFTAPATATYAFFTCGSDLDSVLHVFSGDCGALVPVTSNDDWCDYQSKVRAPMTEGDTCYIRLAGYDGETGGYTLTAEESTPLPNDLCENAVALALDVSYAGDSTAAGTEFDNGGGYDACDVWFTFAPAADGAYTVSLCGSVIDSTLFVFGGACGDLEELAYNDDYCDYQSQVSVSLDAGETYRIRVADYDEMGGEYTIVVTQAVSDDPCPDDPVTDSGFELGSPNSAWAEYSLNYDTPLCDSSCNSSFSAYEGEWFVWFGGSDVAEEGSVTQDVAIPEADSATLSFYLQIPTAGTTGHVALLVDGAELFRATEADAAEYADWTRVEQDISAYADGGTHTILFESETAAADTDVLNLFVDNVCIETSQGNVTVPNVVGQAQAAAQSALTGAGLVVGAVTQQCSNTVPAGSVISQNPAAGAQAAAGSAVALVVSSGPCSGNVTVPNVVGQTRAAAETAIAAAGLTVGGVTEAYSDSVPADQVISQSPPAGASAQSGTAVSLTVSKGVDPANVESARVALAAAFTAADADGSGGLSLDEARAVYPAMTQAIFNALDTNGDGALDKTELGVTGPVCGCGCTKADLSPEGLKSRLGDLFLGGLALVLLAALSRRHSI